MAEQGVTMRWFRSLLHCECLMSSRFHFSRISQFLGYGLVLFTLCFAGLGAQPASAHNSLVESSPSNGDIVKGAVGSWSLTFTGDVPLDSASAEVVADTGVRTVLGAPQHGVTQKQIVFALPANLAGAVTARWRLVGTDGHVISARVSFTVEQTTSTVQTTIPGASNPDTTENVPVVSGVVVAESNPTPETIRLLLRAFGYVALLLAGGLVFAELFLARGVLGAVRSQQWLLGATAVMTAVPLFQVLVFLDDTRDFGVFGSVVHIFEAFDTTPGSMHIVRFFAGAALFAGALRVRQSLTSGFMPLMLASGALYLVSLAYTGHSRSMAWPVLGVPTDVAHTAASIVWLGGLIVFVAFVLPLLDGHQGFDAFRRFGDFAKYAVGVIVVTGVIQTLRLHGSIITLFTESHGRWLLLKMIFVATMLKIGDINRKRILKGLPTSEEAVNRRISLIRRASVTEAINGGVIIVITAVLVSASFN